MEEVRKIISTSLPKSCSLDPLPASLLKEEINIISPSIAKIVNKPITSGCFPSIYKLAGSQHNEELSACIELAMCVQDTLDFRASTHIWLKTPCWSRHSLLTENITAFFPVWQQWICRHIRERREVLGWLLVVVLFAPIRRGSLGICSVSCMLYSMVRKH